MAISETEQAVRAEAQDLFQQAIDMMKMPSPAYVALSNDDALRVALVTILLADDDGVINFDLSKELIQKRITTIIALMVVATEG